MPILLFSSPRCVFAHVPKTGGHSIRVHFRNEFEPWHGGKVPDQWRNEFSFGFVRNPFDRLISAWKMFTRGVEDSTWKLPSNTNKLLTLKELLEMGIDDSKPYGHPQFNGVETTTEVRLKNHILPQTHHFYGLEHANFVGRFENLESDFNHVQKQLGLEEEPLAKTHWTRRKPYQEYFDPETRQIAERYYAEDLERFGYFFEA